MRTAYKYAEVGGIERISNSNGVETIVFNPIESDISGSVTTERNGHVSNPRKRGTVLSSYFNLTNTLLGSAVMSLAHAFSQTGWLVGTILLIICGASSAFALHTLALCAMKLKEREENDNSGTDKPKLVAGASFYSIAKASMPQYSVIIDLAIALKCFGVAISYFIVASDLMPFVASHFGGTGAWVRRELWIIISFCLVAPACFLKDLTSLATFSSLSLVFVAFFALLVCLYGAHAKGFDPCQDISSDNNGNGDNTCRGETEAVVVGVQALKAMPVFVYGFTCHQVCWLCLF